jgi:hypothetical protein
MNHIKLKKSLKYFAGALPLMVLGPVLLTAGNIAKNGEKNMLLMALGVFVLFLAMLVFVLAIAAFSKALFDD